MSRDIIQKYVTQAQQLRKELDMENITRSEFDELLNDLKNIEKIQNMLNNEQAKIKPDEIVRVITVAIGVL
jgi:hypothetical protein